MVGRACTWKYRGQVVPSNARITTEMEVVEIGEDARGVFAIGEGSLWVDGVRIYQVREMGMRIVAMRTRRVERERCWIRRWMGGSGITGRRGRRRRCR
jgi:hypothetical protein